jgi:hypothetical protein
MLLLKPVGPSLARLQLATGCNICCSWPSTQEVQYEHRCGTPGPWQVQPEGQQEHGALGILLVSEKSPGSVAMLRIMIQSSIYW